MPPPQGNPEVANKNLTSAIDERAKLNGVDKNSSVKARVYKQNFRECWLNVFAPWMSRSPNQPNSPYCTFCDRQLEGGASHIKRHALSKYHRQRENERQGNHSKYKPSDPPLQQKTRSGPTSSPSSSCHLDTKSSFGEDEDGMVLQSLSQDNDVHTVSTDISRQDQQLQQQQQRDYILPSQHLTSSHHIEEPHIELTHMETQHLQSQAMASNEAASSHQLQGSAHLDPVDCSDNLDEVSVHSGLQHTDLQQQQQGLHSTHQEVIIATSTRPSNSSLFQQPTLLHPKPTEGAGSYMVEFDDPGSSTEVTVANSSGDLRGLGSEGAHITVTIQGHDPMYIHSTAEPALSYSQHETNMKSECISNGIKQEMKPSQSVKKQKRISKGIIKKRKVSLTSDASSLEAPVTTSSTAVNVRRQGTADLRRSRRWYRQKYASHWDGAQEFADWLTRSPEDPNTAYCLACAKSLFGGMAHLRRHALTPYHKKRMVETQKKRQVKLAQQAELRLSAYAQQHAMSDAAVRGLPELLKRILPDSELVRLLNEERLSAMMLVRKENASIERPHQVSVEDHPEQYNQFRSPAGPSACKTEPSVSQSNNYQTREQVLLGTDVDCKQNTALQLKQHPLPSHLPHHYEPLQQHQTTTHSTPHPLHSHVTTNAASSLPNETTYSNSSQFLGSSQDRFIPVHDQQPQHPQTNAAHSESYHITQMHNMPHQSHSHLHDQHQPHHQHQDHHHHQHQQHNHHHICPSSSASDGSDRSSLVSGVPHPPPTSIGECEVPTSCHPVGVPASHSQVSEPQQQQQAGPQYGAAQAVPSPSQFETLPASGGVCSREASSTTVLVHQADASNPEAVHSYTLTDYQGYSTLLQVSGGDVTRWQGRVAIVTGASAGIGAAICRSLVRLGMAVVGVARSHQRIQALSEELGAEPGSLTAIQCDISKDDQVQDMFKQVIDTFGAVHLCINNAGFSVNSGLLDGTPEEWRAMLDVNVVGLCLLTKLSVQSMRERGIDDGHIIHISSVFGHHVARWPNTHFYAATKHAIRALSEGLRQELREAKSHIRVSTISPGRCKTEFAQNMLGDPEVAAKIYSDIDCLTAEDVAASLVHVITAPPRVEINDVLMRPTEQIV